MTSGTWILAGEVRQKVYQEKRHRDNIKKKHKSLKTARTAAKLHGKDKNDPMPR